MRELPLGDNYSWTQVQLTPGSSRVRPTKLLSIRCDRVRNAR